MDRGKLMFDPSARSPAAIRQLELFGGLIGLCLRSQSPLPFELAGYVWKQLLGELPTLTDLSRVDRDTASRVRHIRQNDDPACPDLSAEAFDAYCALCEATFEWAMYTILIRMYTHVHYTLLIL